MIRPNEWSFREGRKYVLALLIGTLSATVLLKIGEIQYLELILGADLMIVAWLFFQNRMRVPIFKPFYSIGTSYVMFIGLAFLLSIFVLDQNFYAYNYTLLKRPVLVTISRIVQLLLDVFYMLYMASLYREDERLCAFGARVYYWIGVLGGIYAIASFPLNYLFDLQVGTYSDSHRLRGFNNEGGSYGTYLVSVILLTVAMYHRKWLSRRQYFMSMALFLVCLVGSQSKAAFFVVLVILLAHMLWTKTGVTRWVTIGAVVLAFAILTSVINLRGQIDTYVKLSATYQKLSNKKSTDGNYVMGRVSGAILGPRMVKAHPLVGIGWGNYPLVRDDPAYRQGTAFSIAKIDSPSLGPLDYMVELGLPLWMYMTWLALKPVYLLRRNRADPWLLGLAMMQPVSNWFGAHLNITYPWVVVGLALGMGFTNRRLLVREPEA